MMCLARLWTWLLVPCCTVSSAGAAEFVGALSASRPPERYVVLRRADVEAVIVDNSAVDDGVLPGHRAGYSGLAALRHARRRENLFVPAYAGLNFEHCHDGTNQPREILFEPRHAPMHLRRVGEYAVELHQPPTPRYRLESRLRYEILPDGAIEMRLECVPRARTFRYGYIGLFFASYIHRPESLDIHFLGCPEGQCDAQPDWVRGVTPLHGTLATHRGTGDRRTFRHDPDFPLTLVFGFSKHRFVEPWYFGVSHGMALVMVFRERDAVWLTQSPSGGGPGNPAWDFQWFIPDYEVGRRYVFVMRAIYVPFESPEQIRRIVAPHRAELDGRADGSDGRR